MINAEEIIVKCPETGNEIRLIDVVAEIIKIIDVLKERSSLLQTMLTDDEGREVSIEDCIWGSIHAIEDLNARLTALEPKNITKPH